MARPSRVTPALLTSTSTGPKRSRDLVEGGLDLPGSRDVGLHSPPVRRERGDRPAVAAQALGDRGADAARAAGDHRARACRR